MTEDEKHDFVAEIVAHLLKEIEQGVAVFSIISWRHDEERNSMHARSASIKVMKDSEEADRMVDIISKLVDEFMDAHAPRWSQ
jgi:hypothetical protein